MIYKKKILKIFFALCITLFLLVPLSIKSLSAEGPVGLLLQPASGDIAIAGTDKAVEFKITPNGKQVVGVQIEFQYISDYITITNVQINNSLGGELIEIAGSHDGIKKYALTFNSNPITKDTTLATVSFKGVKLNTGVDVLLKNAKVVLANNTTSLTISNGGVTIGNGLYNIVTTVINPPPDTTCPSTISSTQARMRANSQDAWTTDFTSNLGDSIFVAGFYNQQTDTLAPDIVLTATGPEGPQSHIVTLNNNDNNVSYKPTLIGKYKITATSKDKTGVNCTGTANLTVNPALATTDWFRIAENPSDLDTQAVKTPWLPYTADKSAPNLIDYTFKDGSAGLKTIFVQFKDSTGKITTTTDCPKCQSQIRILGGSPSISSCALNFEGNNTVLTLTGPVPGSNFGTEKGTVKSTDGTTNLDIKQWTGVSVKAVWPNAPTGQSLNVTLTTADGQTADGICSSTSQLALGAKIFCRQPFSHQTDNVDLVIAGAFPGGTKFPHQTVSIDQSGVVQGINQKLEVGKPYKVSLKAPKGLRRTFPVLITEGTTNLQNNSPIVLPVGDIAPVDGGDGAINAVDKSLLISQWNISGDAAGRSGDFNQDGRVNSIDWACMKASIVDFAGYGGDQPEPVAGGSNTSGCTTDADCTSGFTCRRVAILCTTSSDPSCSGIRGTCVSDNQGIGTTPPAQTTQSVKKVFVTSTSYNGNLGGLSGADNICQSVANNPSTIGTHLGGTWKAWLSDTNTSASSRLTHNNGPYKLLDGSLIANDWSDLISGNIRHAINITEQNTTLDTSYNVWTSTTKTGDINNDPSFGTATCLNWTDSKIESRGGIGTNGLADHSWTEDGYDSCFNQSKRLFCFEQ